MIRALGALVHRELHSQLRGGTLLLVGVVAPTALALLFGIALGGDAGSGPHRVGVVDEDGAAFSTSVQNEVLRDDRVAALLEVRAVDGRASARQAVTDGELDAAIVFARGFSASVGAGRGGEVEVVESPANPVAGAVTRAVVDQMTALIDARTLAVRTSLAAGVPASEVQRFVESNGAAGPSLTVVDASDVGAVVSPSVFYASGVAALFAFLVAGASARSLLTERRLGVLARIHASPVPQWGSVVAKAVVGWGAAMSTMCVTWIASTLVFDDTWGDPVALVALFAAHSAAATCLTMLVAGGARTDAQADGYVLVLSFVFGLTGGSLIPLHQLPDALQFLARFTPNGWTASGLSSLVVSGGGLPGVVEPVAVLLGIAVAAGVGTGFRFRRGILR